MCTFSHKLFPQHGTSVPPVYNYCHKFCVLCTYEIFFYDRSECNVPTATTRHTVDRTTVPLLACFHDGILSLYTITWNISLSVFYNFAFLWVRLFRSFLAGYSVLLVSARTSGYSGSSPSTACNTRREFYFRGRWKVDWMLAASVLSSLILLFCLFSTPKKKIIL
jgi:hypothetical protein